MMNIRARRTFFSMREKEAKVRTSRTATLPMIPSNEINTAQAMRSTETGYSDFALPIPADGQYTCRSECSILQSDFGTPRGPEWARCRTLDDRRDAHPEPDARRRQSRCQWRRGVTGRGQGGPGPVGDRARVARGDPSGRVEGGREGCEFLQGRVPSRVFIGVEHPLRSVLIEDRDRLDLPLEPPLVDCPDRFSVGPQ